MTLHHLSITLLLICSTGFILQSCSTKTTVPKSTSEVLYVGARFYTEDSTVNRIYIFDTDSLVLLDSLEFDTFPVRLRSSVDGHWLYVLRSGGGVDKVSAVDGSRAWSISGIYSHQLLDRGTLVVYGNEVFDAGTGVLLRTAPDSLYLAGGGPNGTTVAATLNPGQERIDGDSVIVSFDVVTGEISGRFSPMTTLGTKVLAYDTQLHPDGETVGVIGVGALGAWFVLGNLNTGEQLIQDRIYHEFGEMAFSRDGHYAAVSAPANFNRQGPDALYVYDLSTMSRVKRFESPEPFNLDSVGYTGQVLFTMEGSYLLNLPDVGKFGVINKIDLRTMEPVLSSHLPGWDFPNSVAYFGGSTLGWRTAD